MSTTQGVPESTTCPICQTSLRENNGELYLTQSEGVRREAQPGDLYICVGCAGISQFDEGLGLAAPADGILAALPPDIQEELSVSQTEIRQLLFQQILGPKFQPADGTNGRPQQSPGHTPDESSH